MDEYKYIRAIVDCGELRWEYKVTGCAMSGSQGFDEDVGDYTNDDIVDLMSMLSVEESQREMIEVEYA